MSDIPRIPAAINNHPALDGTPWPEDVAQQHIWMLDVLKQLHQYATEQQLAKVEEIIVTASNALLEELRAQFKAMTPADGPQEA